MSHNGGPYYPSGPGWQQPGPSGPPQNQGAQLHPQNRNPPYFHQHVGQPSFTPQNQGPQLHPQNQNPPYSHQHVGQPSFTPQNQGPHLHPQNQNPPYSHQHVGQPSFMPQNQGPQYTPQNQDPSYPQNQGPNYPPQHLGPSCPPQNQFPPQSQGSCYPPQNQEPSFPPQNQRPQFHPQNQRPPCQNQGPSFPPQNQRPQFHPQNQCPPCQNQGHSFPPQNQGPHIPPLNQAPLFPPQNQCPLYLSQDQGPPVLPENQGSSFPTQNQQPPFPAQNQGPPVPAQRLCPSQDQGSFLPPQNQGLRFPHQNQGPEFPVQNQGPDGPPENRGPQFPPHNQDIPIHQQNQVPLGPPQNHLFPTQNQGIQCTQQNPGFSGPPQNQGPPIPPQNQHPLFTPQNQGNMRPPQNQGPIFSPQNQGPGFPPQNPNNGPRFAQNNGPPFAPCTQGPAYPQRNDDWESLEEYPDNEEGCGNHGDDWNNQDGEYDDNWSNQHNEHDDNWRNQNDGYDDGDWNYQHGNHEGDWKNQNKDHEGDWRSVRPSVRGRRKVFIKNNLKRNDFKEALLTKRPRMSPKQTYPCSKQFSQKQCSNNIVLVNLVKTSTLNCPKSPQGSKLQTTELQFSTIKSKQILQSSYHSNEQKDVYTKPKEDKCNLRVNENSTQKKDELLQKTKQAEDKEIGSGNRNSNQDSSATSNLQKNNLQSKLIQKINSPCLNRLNKHDNEGFKSNKVKCNPISNETTVQCNDKPPQNLNRLQDIEKESSLQRTKRGPVLTSNDHKDGKESQLIQKTSTGNAKEVKKHDYVDSKMDGSSSVKLNNSLLQCANKEFLKTNKTQAKERLEHPKSNSSLNHKISSPSKNPGQSQKTSTAQQEKLGPILTSDGMKDDKQSQVHNISVESAKKDKKNDNLELKFNYSCSAMQNNISLQSDNEEFPKTNKTQAKQGLELQKSNSSSTLKQKTSSPQQGKLGLTSDDLKDDEQTQIHNTSAESAKKDKKNDNLELKLNYSSNLKMNNSLLQHNNEESPKTNKVQSKEDLENTSSDSRSTLNKRNIRGKCQKPITVQREKLRSSKRLNPQNYNTSDDNTSICTKRIKISDKALSEEEQQSLSKVVAVDTDFRSKPEVQDKAKVVKAKETTMGQTSISQPTDGLEANPKIKIENTNKVKPNETESLPQLKETYSVSNKITNHNQSTVVSQINKTVAKNFTESTDQILNIKTEPNYSIMKAGDESGINKVQKKEALANKMSDHAEISREYLVQNNTVASEVCSIAPDISVNINAVLSQNDCNESTPDDKSQNSDTQINYQPSNDDSQNISDFSGVINPLEANLREFDILDEVEGSDDEEEGDQSTISSAESDSEASDQEGRDVDVNDIDAMLEEGLPSNQKDTENKAPKKLRHKLILEEIGHDHFDLLPEGWIQIMHNSGMPVYLQQKTRVCSMSRPYFLGPGSARSHKIPLSAIPCLQYKRALEVEKKYEEENRKKQSKSDSEQTNEHQPPLLPVISAKIETAEENEAAQSLDAAELQKYCKNVFNFKTISIIPFKSWGDRRKFARMTKDIKKQQRPLLPSGTKLLKFPIHNPDGTISKSKGEWVINPNGKSYVCILHEYVQHALKSHPKYQFKELKNPATPYSATVYIGEMQYGTGMGASKKHAKLDAAKAALEVLIPEMKDKIERGSEFGMDSGVAKKSQNYENTIFDQISITDPRVAEFCAKTTEPPPYAILATCLQRNGMGLGEVKVEYKMNTKRHKEDEFKMSVRNHMAVVLCKNKRDGKQKAAQAILKALHPNIEHFGSLLRMYGNHSIKSVKEKKQEEQEITGLQCKAAVNQPNMAILNKLQQEMRKLAAKRKEQMAKGKFHCQNVLPTASTTDLNKINL